ncbi:DUF4340 domain-containing protein [Anatilimnocola floriformis]|uniref:DUF4340 domain-containing protein n=1 Tax=Anatilimnocola floriformis TaxID=2948575 RepID=UPI0020C2F089|nr:DUF4340 domain-containing protein [Anatilimnocola floriformis]
MNEQNRTIIHVAIAAVVGLLVAYEVGSNLGGTDTPGPKVGATLFPDFKDPLAAQSLKIVKFDEKLGQMQEFEVAEVKGRWAIPSQSNYPADAKDRLRDVASTLIDLKSIGVASEVAEDHQLYGVVEPVKGQTKAGDQGVGELVLVRDKKGDDIFKLIVGKKAAAEGDTGTSVQRFVRKPGEDVVWVADIDMTKLPVEFDQWIEKDLLQLNALDVSKVTLKDYNVLSPQGDGRYGIFPRMEAAVAWNPELGIWKLEQLQRYAQGKAVPDGVTEQEELNKTKLDELKTALDDLKIVNVKRKPAGIDSTLTISQELMNNRDGLVSLQELGFFPTGEKDGKLEIASANGEVIIDMKDGVQYVLRFGNVSSDEASVVKGQLNRYLFVSAQLAPDVLTTPTLQPEPAGPEAPKPAENKSGGGGADQAEEPKVDGPKDPPPATTVQDPPKTDTPKPGPPPMVDPAQAAIDKIRKENRRKMEEWEDRKKKATGRVNELNARFADWYYVISEDVYKKVHLSRADIIKEASGAKDEGYGIDAFRKLETDGIKQIIPSNPGGGPGAPGMGGPGGFNPAGMRGFAP